MARQAGGRTREANANDESILQAAREVFAADPAAPISEVAARAGVGMAALYRRYPSKEHLLAFLCAEGQRTYLAKAEVALAQAGDGFEIFCEFLRRVVATEAHILSGRLAGTFTPTEIHWKQGMRLKTALEALLDRAKNSGRMRTDVTLLDIGLLVEAVAFPNVRNKERAAEIRQRLLAVVIDGLRAGEEPLLGRPLTWEEQESRWSSKAD